MKYRADIDGLRAIAVLAVVAFHLSDKLKGGFVGVDIFFVISGYLIGSILLAEMREERFTLSGFYVRRIRRIVPALAVVLAATTAAAAVALFPVGFEHYAKSLIAATFSASNLYFWSVSGYFDSLSDVNPLLHTWSLSVEEQFYIAFPIILYLSARKGFGWTKAILIALTIASFGLSAWGALRDPEATFFLPHTRAWELLLGVLIALDLFPAPTRAVVREGAAVVGLGLIAGSLLFLDSTMPFPGLAAAPPCLGAALLIWSGRSEQTGVGRLLALPPFVFVGLISYSLYLWHWPLIVLFKQYFGLLVLDRNAKIGLFAAAMLLATLSWWLVERPFRRHSGARGKVFAAAGAVGALLALAGGAIILAGGAPQRFPPQVVRLEEYLRYDYKPHFRIGACTIWHGSKYEDYKPDLCLRRSPDKRNAIIMGDSYSAHLWYGLSQVLPDANVMQASAIGCKPTRTPTTQGQAPYCLALMRRVFGQLEEHPVDLLILSADWRSEDLPQLEKTLLWAKAKGMKAVVIGPGVSYDSNLPLLLATAQQRHDPSLPERHYWAGPREVDRELDALTKRLGVGYGSALKALCDDHDKCVTLTADGRPIQFDHAHYTRAGSVVVASRLASGGLFRTP